MAYGRSEAWKWSGSNTDYADKILPLSERAIEIDPNNVTAYIARAYHLGFNGRWNDIIRAANAGLAIDPNSAALLAARAFAEGQVGRYEEGTADREKARRSNRDNPDPDMPWFDW